VPMVKITGGQRIDLLGIRKEQLPAIWEALDMPSGHAYAKAVRTVKTCVGTDFCRFGLGDAIEAGVELERETVVGLRVSAQLRRVLCEGHRDRRGRGRLGDLRWRGRRLDRP
jgi:NAD(P)H-nitrite reductase large subunit